MSIPEVFPRTPTTAAMGPKARALLATISEYDDFYGILLDVLAEARAPLLAELRAQAFGEPRCVPLSIIERIFADPEAEVRAVSAPPPLDAGLRGALRRQHLEETHNASGSCPGWGCPTARALAALEEPTDD